MTLFQWMSLLFLLAASAFCSLSETALVGLSKLRLQHMIQQGVRHAKGLRQLIRQLDEVITSIVVANNFVNTAISSIGAGLCIAWLGPEWGIPAATLFAGSLILVLGEITPKVFAIRHTDRVSIAITPWLLALVKILGPLARIFRALSNSLLRVIGVKVGVRSPLVTQEEIKLMIQMGREEGILMEHEREMLHRVFEFGDQKVQDVMIPKKKMVIASGKASHDEILQLLTEEGHSRIPIYRDSPDEIDGIIYAQELLHVWREGALIVLEDLIHPAFKIPPDRSVSQLLQEFQRKHIQIAIVVDPEGKTLGLVTLEDLIEEIVGDIEGD